MISLRNHVISIAAVFLALAVGVVLGSTSLSNRVLGGLADDRANLSKQVSDLQSKQTDLSGRLTDADRYALATGPLAVHGALDGKSVVLITTADAKPTDRDGVAALLRAAGANVTGELQLTDAFTDPTKSDQLRSLVARLLPAGVQLPTAADPGTLAGGLIGPLLLLDKTTGKPQASPDETAAALTGLASGGYVRQGQGLHAAQLALVLTGGSVGGDAAADRAAVIARFATQVQRSGGGTVLAGRTGSADNFGPLAVVRADGSVLSTVDDVDNAAGQVVTVLALRDAAAGKTGAYGTAGNAQAPAPAAPAG
ncbi:copper transporter [Kutzneria buriramensis]|uniref:Copper transport outer membrane protein MctB n=1 Tax=Kutzneria buriramensis TaxID=1045776 RepID=A0A3E0I4V3_9PSEU|nr:copper transporter [Kutzneria buriramensis]REH53794.1 copper transport outer membrane protein MctB [Kutzneria buriramensis]